MVEIAQRRDRAPAPREVEVIQVRERSGPGAQVERRRRKAAPGAVLLQGWIALAQEVQRGLIVVLKFRSKDFEGTWDRCRC